MLTASQLKQIVPFAKQSNIDAFLPHLNALMPKWNINNPHRVAAFISEVAHESGSFKYVREIASGKAYEGRIDLGNTTLGDGVKFRGHGLIQITGRKNHRNCSLALFGDDRLDKNPELLTTPQYAVESACWFWDTHGLNELADNPANFDRISKIINGGTNGQLERRAFYKRALAELITPTKIP